MRRVIVSMNVTLNGYMAGPYGDLDWHYNRWGDDIGRAIAIQLSNAGTLLMGRVTYQAMAGYYQVMANRNFGPREDTDFADMINNCPKVVFSKKPGLKLSWPNARLAAGSIQKEIWALKQTAGKDILIYGSGAIVQALAKLNLVDEYCLWVHPVVIKNGRPLFKGTARKLAFAGLERFASGVVLMRCLPEKPE